MIKLYSVYELQIDNKHISTIQVMRAMPALKSHEAKKFLTFLKMFADLIRLKKIVWPDQMTDNYY